MSCNGETCIPCALTYTMDASTPVGAVGEPTSVRLFGVKLTDIPKIERDVEEHSIDSMDMRKTVSMNNLCLAVGMPTQRHLDMALGLQEDVGIGKGGGQSEEQTGYVSDCLMQNSSLSSRERRKGVPWTEEEHRLFLAGLQKLGKGDWRGISRNFVTSRTPTQVASHAQKYFLRRASLNKRKRRSSLFDIINSNAVFDTSLSLGAWFANAKVPAGNGNDEHSHNATAAELWERQMPHPAAAFSAGITSSIASTNHPMPAITNVSSELCLGRLSQLQQKESRAFTDQGLSLVGSRQGRQRDAGTLAELDKSVFAIASCQSRSLSSSPSPSPSRSSLSEIEKVSELSSLSLSIAPPVSTDLPSELALKLEPPMVSRQQKTVIFESSSKVHKPKDVLLIAGA